MFHFYYNVLSHFQPLSPVKSPSSPTGPMTRLIFLSLRAECGNPGGGGHPRIVQERLGHSSIATTLDIYSHTVPGLQKAAAERLDNLLPKIEESENVGRRGRG